MATQTFLKFSPRKLGRNDPIWRAYFSNGLVQPPTRWSLRGIQKELSPPRPNFQTLWEPYVKGNPKSLNFYFLVIWWGKMVFGLPRAIVDSLNDDHSLIRSMVIVTGKIVMFLHSHGVLNTKLNPGDQNFLGKVAYLRWSPKECWVQKRRSFETGLNFSKHTFEPVETHQSMEWNLHSLPVFFCFCFLFYSLTCQFWGALRCFVCHLGCIVIDIYLVKL